MRAKLLLVIFAASVCALALTLGSGELPSPGGKAQARSAVLSEGIFIPIGGDGGGEVGPASHAPATVPGLINFQGRLTVPSTGNAVADGNYSLTFRLCATQSPGDCSTPLWTETQAAVPVSGGLFSVQLGSVTPFAGSEFDGSVRYLEVQVGADPAMTPRLLFTTVAYAFHALDAESANSAEVAFDLTCVDCVGSGTIGFNYAGSDSEGGPANNVACTGCVSNTDIADGSISGTDIQDGSITTFELQDGGVISADMANSAIQSNHINNLAVGTSQLAADAVTSAKVAFNYAASTVEGGPASDVSCTGCVNSTDILDGTILNGDILDGTITGADIAGGTVTSTHIANGTIASIDIADGAVTGTDVQDGTLTSADVASAANSQLLDNIDSASFLRSDAVDSASAVLTFANGVLNLNNGTGSDGDYLIQFFDNGSQSDERFAWVNASDTFQLTDDLSITEGSLSVGAGTLTVGSYAAGSATTVCRNGNTLSTCSSSARYKDDITTLAFDGEKLLALRPVRFTWKESGEPGVGLVAEEVAEVLPELVTYNDEGEIEGVNYDGLTAYLLQMLQQQQQLDELASGGQGGSASAPATAGDGFGAMELALVLAVTVAAAAIISAGTTLVVVRATQRRAA